VTTGRPLSQGAFPFLAGLWPSPTGLARPVGDGCGYARDYHGCSARGERISLCVWHRDEYGQAPGAAVLLVALLATPGCMTQRSVQGATCEDVGQR